MSVIYLFVNIAANQILASATASTVIDPGTLPLYYGDTPTIQLQFIQPTSSGITPTLAIVPIAGLSPALYLDDGTVAGGATPYTQQLAWTPDPNGGQFWTAPLPLNTVAIQTLLGTSTSVEAWIKLGYTSGGYPTTVLSQKVNIRVGLPVGALVTPPGQTPISLETARALFLPQTPVPGQPLPFASPTGHVFLLLAVDNADGTQTYQVSQLN